MEVTNYLLTGIILQVQDMGILDGINVGKYTSPIAYLGKKYSKTHLSHFRA